MTAALVLDAGALFALERGDRAAVADLAAAHERGLQLRTSAIVLGQVWRDGVARPTTVARLLAGIDVVPVDTATGQAVGALGGRAGTGDPVRAAVVLAARPGDLILTSDPDDMAHLVRAAGAGARVVAC